ncbi:DoxX family protein [Mucilaginibacter sp.]|uniref:DoxX family protein n=1 Tax=Mucilaginibacter sp. TaxID=1882438 RepID=UPI0026233C6F|nr:DoxX family protein [Mucilaginibacter sp.]MDB5032054.1 DoxX-like family protein [Mucilaginibacter sp.]
MKTLKITYWITTGIVALMMMFSAYAYVTQDTAAKGFHHLGYPDYFRVELAVCKLIGAILLLAPVAVRFKEWAYAAFTIVFISAFIAHTASGDPISMRIMPVIIMGILIASYITYHKMNKAV